MGEDIKVILVDENDVEVGTMEKMAVHETGQLHRAVSVFIFNSNKEMLLQKRAITKYHSKGLWSNTCCSHPFPGESTKDAAERRLREEMGISETLEKAFDFVYQTPLENNLQEYEFDHVYIGRSDTEPFINPNEADDYRWISISDLKHFVGAEPDQFTVWFKIIVENHLDQLMNAIDNESL